MATYEITSPDGKKLQITAPDGTSQDQVLAYARDNYKPAPAQSPAERANQAGIAMGRDQSPLSAGIGQASQQGTFGLSNYINAGARWLAQRATGVQNPDDFNTDVAYSRGVSQGEIEGHPVAGTVGGVTGGLLGGGALGTGLKLLRGARVAAQAPSVVSRLAGGAATGGALGTTQALAQGQGVPQAALTGAESAATGGALSAVAPAIASRLAPASARAWSLLAKSLNMRPDDLAAAAQAHETVTGAKPSMAMLSNGAAQGSLRSLAAANPDLAMAARTAADQGGAPIHQQLATMNASGASRPQTRLSIDTARNAYMDNAMDAPSQQGVALRDEPVPDPNGILTAPHVDFAMRPNTGVNARLNQASPVMDRINNGTQTVGDIDTVRRALRDQQMNFLRDAPGGMHARDPAIAKEFGDLATQLEQLGTIAHPDYGAALNQYRGITDYGNGFDHGLSGGEILKPNDPHTATSLQTGMGQAGYAHGQALAVGQRALDTIAPPVPGAPASPARAIAHTAAAIGSGGLSTKIYHAISALTGTSVNPATQRIIASQLFNPATVTQGIANLRRAKVSQAAIADFAKALGGATGAAISNNLQNTPASGQ